MFIIDFSLSKADILSDISERNSPTWTVPLFDFIRSWFDDSVTHFTVQTSGSTGTPKQIQHSREAMTASASLTCDFFQLKQGDTALLALPSTHIGGKMMIVRSIIRGLKLICIEPRSNPLTQLDSDTQIAFAAFTPMQMTLMMDDASSHPKLSKIKQIILGGGEVSYVLRERLQGIDAAVYETYGMTETISHIALKKLNGTDRSENFTALAGVKIALDPRGCLIIEAPHLSSSALITNDIVRIISDKEFQWLGRYDNVINTGGIKVSAEEIERKLQPYIKYNFFITGLPDDKLGQRVSLVLETFRYDKLDDSIFIDLFNTYLDKFERPRKVLVIDKFSYTENGKINKPETLRRLIQK